MGDSQDIGPLNFERCQTGIKTTNSRWPQTIAVVDELITELEGDGTADVTGDELCFSLTNGRALYRRVEHNLEVMVGWYRLVGAVGPTDG